MKAAPFVSAELTGRVGRFQIDAAFEIPAQGVTALVGPSGSGKSTVLRCLAGLTHLKGRVTVGSEVWQDHATFRPTHKRPVGMVFQEPSLLPHLTVRQNLAYGFTRTNEPRQIGFDEVVTMMGLSALIERAPDNLSGGERQRVALGRALLSQPRLLLMDEPLSSLDAEAKAEIAEYIERLHRTLATPIVYVSHDQSEVRRLADRVLTMDGGRVAELDQRVLESGAPGSLSRAMAEAALDQLSPEEVRGLALTAIQARWRPGT